MNPIALIHITNILERNQKYIEILFNDDITYIKDITQLYNLFNLQAKYIKTLEERIKKLEENQKWRKQK